MAINFTKIIPTEDQVNELYVLLKKREHSISHKNIPSNPITMNLFLKIHILFGILYTKKRCRLALFMFNPIILLE